jgi:hypothetical protein
MSGPGDVNATQPLRLVDQHIMERIFTVTDAAGLSREAIRVPLAGEGEGRIEETADGSWEIVVPAGGSLDSYFARLAEAFGVEPD